MFISRNIGSLVSNRLSNFDNIFGKVNEDIIFKTQAAYNKDTFKNKVDLSIGIYADKDGILPPPDSRYLSLSGDINFLNASEKFVYNKTIPNMFKFQTCGGTGALSLANQIINFNRQFKNNVMIPSPTWPNHLQIFENHNTFNNYIYNLNLFKNTLAPNVLLIQTSCHNPTGIDYNDNEKKFILDYAEENNVSIIFDTAYLGLSGDFNNEVNFLKMAVDRNIDFIVCLSFSKIADVYGHRVGALFFRPKQSEYIDYNNIKPNIEQLIRKNISNVPRFGSDKIMMNYLGDDTNIKLFKEKIQNMADRINDVRIKFGKDLADNGIKNNISEGKGMFSLLELPANKIVSLQNKYHIYLLPNGRINICGINNKNYDYIIESIISNNN
jgi:aspartate aminotransferase